MITCCTECGGPLRFGSRDPLEGDYWWCSVCGDGPYLFPLYGGPKAPASPIIEAHAENNRVLAKMGR